MDIDGPPVSTPTGDVEASLLQQFNCLGTTDHEELISQMQQLMGITYGTALFFLDMNNWNLQAAVCSYLDLNVEDRSSSTPNATLYGRTVSPISTDQYSVNPLHSTRRDRRNALAIEAGMGSDTPPPPGMLWSGVDLRGGSGGSTWRGEGPSDVQMDTELSERMAVLSAAQPPSCPPPPSCDPPPDRPAC